MIIHESWKYYEVDIFKLTDNMSDKFIMWSVTLSRDHHMTRVILTVVALTAADGSNNGPVRG